MRGEIMPVADHKSTSRRDLHPLWASLTRARHRVEQERVAPKIRSREVSVAQAEFLDALERYADALVEAGRPLPYRLRDELALYRTLCPKL